LLTTPPQVPLHNRYEALAVEDKSVDDVGANLSTPQEPPKPERPNPPYYYHLHKEDKTGHSCRRLPSEGNRESNMLGRSSS